MQTSDDGGSDTARAAPRWTPWSAPIMDVAPKAGNDVSALVRRLRDAAPSPGGVVAVAHDTGVCATAADILDGCLVLDVRDFRPDDLGDEVRSSPVVLGAIRALAGRVCGLGIAARQAGELERAGHCALFGLRVAAMLGDADGVEALTANLLVIASSIASELDTRDVGAEGRVPPDAAAGLETVRRTIAVGAKETVPEVERRLAAADGDRRAELQFLVSLRRLQALGGESASRRRATLARIEAIAVAEGHPDELREAIYEELACTDIVDILVVAGKIRPEDAPAEAAEFAATWAMYERWRGAATSGRPAAMLRACTMALDRITSLRRAAVAAGGQMGHTMSYTVAQYASILGRDLCEAYVREGCIEEGLAVAEATTSRALVDWMARTHASDRLVLRQGTRGSVGEVRLASIEEIQAAAAMGGAPILHYFGVRDGTLVWCVSPDGAIVCDVIPSLSGLVSELAELLPYGADANAVRRGERQLGEGETGASVDRARLDALLDELGTKLLPERILAALDACNAERIALVTDLDLQFVPFPCLRVRGRYLVETHEIIHWPSTTAWILCEGQVALWRRGFAEPSECLVIGDPVADDRSPQALPGARREARRVAEALGVTPRIGAEATFDALFESFHRPTSGAGRSFVPIAHIASHGELRRDKPEASYVALADTPLTAWFLYTFDPGLRGHLVVLSCCQTGLGHITADSAIGLTNAFLIAGACCVGSTLWRVSDDATEALMSRFYDELRSQPRLSAALAAAQRALLADPATSHPRLWAGVRLTGSDSPVDALRSPRSRRSSSP